MDYISQSSRLHYENVTTVTAALDKETEAQIPNNFTEGTEI